MKYRSGRKTLAAACGLLLLMPLSSCSKTETASPSTVDVGLLTPLSGALEEVGVDAKDAFEGYIAANDNKLGGREVNISIRDEGDSAKTSLPSAEKLMNGDNVDVIVGAASSANYIAVAPETTKAEIPLLGYGGQPDLKDADIDFEWLWQTSFSTSQLGASIAPYLEKTVDGPVYAIAPDYEGGQAIMGGFVKPFQEVGGELASGQTEPTWTPWPDTMDFSEYFQEAANSDAEAIFAYYAGAPAVEFVKQYAKSPAKDIPLYGAFLTEGAVLEAQGESAKDIQTVMNYAPDIDNAANRRFISEWSEIAPDRSASLYSMVGWDAALVLDQAISRIPANEEVTPAAINEAMGQLGTINSSRGSWQFDEDLHIPIQKWYLRTVMNDGPALANVVTEDLSTIGG